MSLSYANPYPVGSSTQQKPLDDNYVRAPVILAPEQVNPLTATVNSEYISRTWRLATIGKSQLVDGHRLENALWRLWAQQRLGLRRIHRTDIDWERFTMWKYKSLLGPVVTSQETCIHSIELSIASAFHPLQHEESIHPAIPPLHPPVNELVVPTRPCLRRRSTSPGEISLFNYSNDFHLSSSPSRHHRVLFNKCVVQCIIKEDFSSSEQDETSDFEVKTPGVEDNFDLPPVPSYSQPHFTENIDTLAQYERSATLSRCPTITSADYFVSSIEPLPPVQLHPTDNGEGKDGNVVFVPPPGMEGLSEAELLPCEREVNPFHRTKSSQELIAAEEADIAMEAVLEEFGKRNLIPTRKKIEQDEDEEVTVMECRGRRRRSKQLFIMEDEDERVNGEGSPQINGEFVETSIDMKKTWAKDEFVQAVVPANIDRPPSIGASSHPDESQEEAVSASDPRLLSSGMLSRVLATGARIGWLLYNLWS